MNAITKCVGLDVSKEKIAVAVADQDASPRFCGVIPNTREAIRKQLRRLGESHELRVCYEAGVTGYGLSRFLQTLGIECVVAAPSKIERVPGPRVKTDRKDALMLAEKLRKGDLVSVWVPDEGDEALRDLVRARKARMEDRTQARQRVSMFLMRHGIVKPDTMTPWGNPYRTWLRSLTFVNRASQTAFQEYVIAVEETEMAIGRLEQEIHEIATHSSYAPMMQALQALRGFKEIAAATVVAEIGDFTRFAHPQQLMSYAGLVPRESSSGNKVWRGAITKTGNPCLRWILTESAWSYRYRPSVSASMAKRMEGLSPHVQAIAWKAQNRLHRKYMRLLSRGKSRPVALMAVARELLGFIWAIAQQVSHESNGSAGLVA